MVADSFQEVMSIIEDYEEVHGEYQNQLALLNSMKSNKEGSLVSKPDLLKPYHKRAPKSSVVNYNSVVRKARSLRYNLDNIIISYANNLIIFPGSREKLEERIEHPLQKVNTRDEVAVAEMLYDGENMPRFIRETFEDFMEDGVVGVVEAYKAYPGKKNETPSYLGTAVKSGAITMKDFEDEAQKYVFKPGVYP